MVPNPASFQPDPHALARKYLEHGEVATAMDEASVVGLLAMYANDHATRAAYISLLAVRDEYRSFGIGHALVQDAVVLARQLGMTAIELNVMVDNARALAFYQRLGFFSTSHDGVKLRMRKQL